MELKYRSDIDGIRALAVISVILFHLGFLPNGYLGVDVFFVISGYLITSIIYSEVLNNTFSIVKFYERRIRRIFPLVLFTTLFAFLLGIIFMLPDDLENLSQSVFASNFSSNNILMLITSSDYWAVKNDYKPLMHTWSLGIEEQFYLCYPLIFYFFKGEKIKFILPTLFSLTLLSFFLFLYSENVSSKFYLIQYRFFELSIGGICSIYFSKSNYFNDLFKKSGVILFVVLFVLASILFFNLDLNNDAKLIITVVCTVTILVIGSNHYHENRVYKSVLSNKITLFIGKISFSLYMWHQIVFAFARYFLFDEISIYRSLLLMLLVIILSILSYYLIENTFRNKEIIKKNQLILIIGLSFLIITSSSFYVYTIGGIIKNIPQLGIINTQAQNNFLDRHNNINIQYNENIRRLDTVFVSKSKNKILIIGDSFGRDFANILLESKFNNKLEISFYDYESNDIKKDLDRRVAKADFVFFATNTEFTYRKYNVFNNKLKNKIELSKVWIVGIKDFGKSNGIFYNRTDIFNEYKSYTTMKKGVKKINEKLQKNWGVRYINLINLISDSAGRVLVFTPDNKFISQDTLHLTKYGAIFFSELLEKRLSEILF